jgi:mRNA interferase MazF
MMMFMMPSNDSTFEFGDIVLVPFPFTNQVTSKQRPAAVISGSRFNQSRPDLIVMAVTSQLIGEMRADDIPVLNWETAGLLKPSAIKPVIATLEQGLILRRLGTLDMADCETLQAGLRKLLSL